MSRQPFRAEPIQLGPYYKAKQARRRRRAILSYSGGAVAVAATFCTVFFWPASTAQNAKPFTTSGNFQCEVARITDGDTLRCSDGTRIRLHAVAARETDETCSPGHPCPTASAASATAKLSELASGQTLSCTQTGTSYNRITAICRNEENVEINCAMVNSGTALIWPRYNAQRRICE